MDLDESMDGWMDGFGWISMDGWIWMDLGWIGDGFGWISIDLDYFVSEQIDTPVVFCISYMKKLTLLLFLLCIFLK